MPDSFVHLRVHTAYSLLEGAIKPGELAPLCNEAKMPAVAVTDTNNLFGSLELSLTLSGAGIQPIIGCVLDFKPHEQDGFRSATYKEAPEQLVFLAQNEQGYQNLLKLVSLAYLEPAGELPLLDYEQIEGLSEGIICLTGGPTGGLARLLTSERISQADQFARRLKELFEGRLYIELQRHGLPQEEQAEAALIKLAMDFEIPLVATNDVYFATKDKFQAHDALLCIAEGRYVSEEDRRKVTAEHYFKDAAAMRELFSDIPEAIENTLQIAKRCAFMSPKRAPILPRFGDIEQERMMLNEKAKEGLERRLQRHVLSLEMSEEERQAKRTEYEERLKYEIEVINQMGFPGYFLIVADFIQWSKEHGIPVGPGRGSGAGSIVAWALRITDLDPIRFGLLFERFLNPERVSMPDFDIDFCQDRRDEVIHYVQGKYGADQVAQIITFGKLQARAVLRDVGRVLQLPYGQVDRICKLVPNNPANPVTLQEAINSEPALREAIREDETVERMVKTALKLEGLYRHASTHAAGVVIGDRPLVELLPLYRDPRSDMLVVQYSMKYAELAGLVKFDFLGLKTLTVLETARRFVAENHGVELDLLKLPEGDPKTYEMLGQGESTGVFQLESSGMRDTLCKLKPDTIEDIIALVSLYRPGPMDNIPTYIARKHGKEKPEYLHPDMEPILGETFGVMIYQEQVMQIAQKLASYSLGEADILRRAMGKKIASEMEAQRTLFTERAIQNGVKENTARAIFDLMAKFASYGFNKSHAAAYALIAYQTAYLKANYPAEFIAASMTYDIHNTDKLAIFKDEAARYGIAMLPPDVNASYADFRVEKGELAIRYALGALKNVGEAAMESLVKEREANGPFETVFDLVKRCDSKVLNKRQMENLIRAGAFDSLEGNRKKLMQGLDVIMAYGQSAQRERESDQVSLFAVADGGEDVTPVPSLPECSDWLSTERLTEEFSAVGFYLNAHPLESYKDELERMRVTPSIDLPEKLRSEYTGVRVAGIVTGTTFKRSQKGRFAFLSLSDQAGAYEASIFDEGLLDSQRELLAVGSLLMVSAEGKKDDGGIRLIVKSLTPLDDAVSRPMPGVSGDEKSVLRLRLDSLEMAKQVKECLPEVSKRGTVIEFSIPCQEGARIAVVKLEGKYALTPPIREQLMALTG